MSKAVTQDDKLRKLREIVKAVDICMLTTVDERGELHSRPMSNNRDVEFDGDLWFFTYGSSHKVDEVNREAKVNASFADVDNQLYASLTGRAEVVRDRAKIEELWEPILKTWFTGGKDDPRITVIKVAPIDGYYWDTKHGSAAAYVKMLIGATIGKTLDDSIEGKVKV